MKKIFLLLIFVVVNEVRSQGLNTNFTYSVYSPPLKTKKPPVVFMLHGYGSNEGDLFGLADKLDKRLMVISLRAPRITNNGGYCWYELDFLANGEFKYNYQQVLESKKLILDFIKKACDEFDLDSTQIYLMGFSQGAILSYELAFSFPERIKGILALSGRMLEETKLLTASLKQISHINFFIAHGSNDHVINSIESEKAHTYVKSKTSNQVFYKVYAMAHTIQQDELKDIQRWFGEKLIK